MKRGQQKHRGITGEEVGKGSEEGASERGEKKHCVQVADTETSAKKRTRKRKGKKR